mmetsp:Transcript_20346/g.36352  ORF Transcript_20346/g.36352 Transcript_20346/m.36352 type:complete len:177 (-) Transcript_20346:104-634(-)
MTLKHIKKFIYATSYTRGALKTKDAAMHATVARHLEGQIQCRGIFLEIANPNRHLRMRASVKVPARRTWKTALATRMVLWRLLWQQPSKVRSVKKEVDFDLVLKPWDATLTAGAALPLRIRGKRMDAEQAAAGFQSLSQACLRHLQKILLARHRPQARFGLVSNVTGLFTNDATIE